MADEKDKTKISNSKKTADKKTAEKKAPAKKAAAKKEPKKAAAKKAEPKAAKGKEKAKAPAKKAAAKKAPSAPVAPPVVRASARYVRIAPRKARLIADQVRGLHIEKARALLQFSPRGAAEDIHKLIDSAAANAENNHDLIGDEMRVSSITVDEGPTLKRFRPRAQGRATPIHKRTSHIAVALTPVED
ncbi:MAG: 50S ribosomal protein L22 [Thermoleophilia bacterium]|nr:50S ribosomal protein L22 [Thermoleophilia bacterium]